MFIAHVDMDAFFAAVEEKYNPKLRGKPLMVGALPTSKRGIISTCNYEARKFGIHSAMPVSEAYRRCPEGNFVKPQYHLYKKESLDVMKILKSFGTEVEQVSVDEAYLDITELVRKQSVGEVAKKIKKTILEKTELSCSIGVSSSRYVSKIASDYKKPGGIIIVKDNRKFLEPLPVEKIPGVGKKSKIFLNEKGIVKIGDLAKLDNVTVHTLLGKWGPHLHRIAKGEDETGIKYRGRRKSQGHETTFMEDVTKEECVKALKKLCKITNEQIDYSFRTVTLKVRFSDFSTITRSKTPKNVESLEKTALEIFDNVHSKKKIRLIGVRVSNLHVEKEKQLTLR